MSQKKRTLATCCAVHTLHDGLSDITYVLLPLLAQAFGLSLAQVGLIRSAHRAAMAIFQIPAGIIAERLGERNLLAFGTACAGIAFVALGFAPGFPAILLTLFLAGFGSAVQHPLCSSIISHAYPGEGRRAALGTYNFAGDLGKFAFGGAASLMFVAGVSWQTPVLLFGGTALACVAAIVLLLSNAGAGAKAAPAEIGQTRVTGWGIRNKQDFTALCAIEVLDSSTRTGFLTFVAFLLMARGLPEGWAAASVPLILVGGMAGKLACGILAERLGIVRMIVITEVATGCGIFATLALPNLAAFILLPLIGVVLNGTSSVLYATIGDFVEKDRLSRAFGLFYTLGSTCGVAAPLAYGLVGDVFGVETAIAVIGFAIFLTIPLALMMKPAAALKPVTR
ncbi:MAG: MFS transporter [Betaproteobacteria bacterium]|nr:MFS transporter [Betaproteobacteria bacterium]